MHTIIDRRDLDFMLFDVLRVEELNEYERFADHDRQTYRDAIQTAYNIALDKFLSHYVKSDRDEPYLVDGKVKLVPEVREALDEYISAGFMTASRDYQKGGMQLPFLVETACNALFSGANVSTFGYLGLSKGNASLLEAYASDEQKRLFMEPIYEGRYSGTMCLSEPQAGSSLADIKTRAIPTDQGYHRIEGAKMWISGGDHELTENIIHLVLARVEGAPRGTKGISLFIVPKYRVSEDGARGEFNDVQLAGLNHKMGHRGITNCFLKFGEEGNCRGYLVGGENRGLHYMFHMMNHARIAVGSSAVMLGYAGYLYSLEYARERVQGRRIGGEIAGQDNPVSIIQHTDVKRMLLQQRAYVQGSLALVLWAARLEDDAVYALDRVTRENCALLLNLLTPVVKSWSSEYCLKANELALQVLGGYGYTREYLCEQFYRDNRLNPIHEGTSGIQGLTLLGRLLPQDEGRAFDCMMQKIACTVKDAAQITELEFYASALNEARSALKKTSFHLLQRMSKGDLERALSNSSMYLDTFGLVIVGWMWLKQSLILINAERDIYGEDFTQGKLNTFKYFFNYELVRVNTQCKIMSSMDNTLVDMQDAWF